MWLFVNKRQRLNPSLVSSMDCTLNTSMYIDDRPVRLLRQMGQLA